MIASILPAGVVAEESHADGPAAGLFPEELRLTAGMSEARRREFAAVRHCARRAARRLGVPDAPLLPGHRGAPRWPAGVVGSMTHCPGYRAAALARAEAVRAVGIDAEPHAPVPERMARGIALPEERERLRALHRLDDGVCWDRLLFCAKEAVYKVWSPLTGVWLGFHEASITIDPDTRTFRARVLRPVPAAVEKGFPAELHGTWTTGRGLLIAAIVLPTAPSALPSSSPAHRPSAGRYRRGANSP
ncbi:4'-phosphopantetheinyl transferase family protein [Streptomyces sp. L500]|uniref:4'-phosphopantetheinyl transferase family protein n=1 Tax=Streptomyces abikoensis TaxID=97398 RepID=UPI0036B3BB6D